MGAALRRGSERADPAAELRAFLDAIYAQCVSAAGWDRAALSYAAPKLPSARLDRTRKGRAGRASIRMLRVHLFGRPRLLLDEIALPLASRPKVVPLLAYLLLHRGAALPRQAVAGALWPDDPEDGARANLRRHLNYLQHVLPPAAADRPWVVAGGG